MGWWKESANGRSVELGDEPLDRIHEAIDAVSRVYLEDVGRKPTLEEFRQTLLQVLRGDPGQLFADMEQHVVGEIVFRRKKIPKRQSFAVGDYFAIPLDGKFWYGRIIHVGAAGHLVEIYDLERERFLTLRELLAAKRRVLFNKHLYSVPAFTRGRWRIIGHEDVPKDFKYPGFYGGLVAYGNYIVWRGDKESREPKRVAMKLEPKVIFGPEDIEAALRARQFGEWPEIASIKKRDFDKHDENVKRLHEKFQIPMKRKQK